MIRSSVPELDVALSGHDLVVTLDRPSTLNALNTSLLTGLGQIIREFATDQSAAVMIVTGRGERAFSAGADIKEWMASKEIDKIQEFLLLGHEVFNSLEACPKPVICALNGVAFGGGFELALACDVRIAADHAQVAFPEPMLGAFPGWGGLRRLVRSVGLGPAKHIAMTARKVPAAEAKSLGLVSAVTPLDDLLRVAREISSEVQQLAPMAVGQIKRLCGLYADGTDGLTGRYFEAVGNAMLSTTADFHEGEAAFLEKRKARFVGR